MVTSLHPPTQTWNQLDLHDSLYPAEVDFDSMSLTLRDTLNTMDALYSLAIALTDGPNQPRLNLGN